MNPAFLLSTCPSGMTQLQAYLRKYKIIDNRNEHLGQRRVSSEFGYLGNAKTFLAYSNKVSRSDYRSAGSVHFSVEINTKERSIFPFHSNQRQVEHTLRLGPTMECVFQTPYGWN
jgi:hypothetical protein